MQLWKRSLYIASLLAMTGMNAFSAETPGANNSSESKAEDIDIKKVSEAFGHFIGRNLKTSGLGFDVDSFIRGIRDGLNDKPAPMPDKEYEHQMTLLQERAFKQLADENLKAADAFMQKNSKEKGIVELEPGKLQYEIIKEGNGAVVKEHGSPQIQYTGKYLDGTVFGSSQDAGGPLTIPLDQTIPGFSKGLIGMKEGEVRKIYVHPDLGYGKSGHLSPNAMLIFEVELVKADNPAQSLLESKEANADISDNDVRPDQSTKDDEENDEDIDDDDEDDNEEPPAKSTKEHVKPQSNK